MPQSHEVSFDGLPDPVLVTFDEVAGTVTTTASGGSAAVFVGDLEPPAAPDVVEAEPIIDPAPSIDPYESED